MKIWVLVFATVGLSVAMGCAGGEGCSAQAGPIGKARYAGKYTASYTPVPDNATAVSFMFTLDTAGQVSGTVGEGESVDGAAGDRRSGCSISGTELSFLLHKTTGEVSTLHAERGIHNSLAGNYSATRVVGETASQGTLSVSFVQE